VQQFSSRAGKVQDAGLMTARHTIGAGVGKPPGKVSIGVKPDARGQGVGEKLMRALIAEATRRKVGLCLSVRSENPARRLYERLGFREIRGSAAMNRACGMSVGMELN